MIQRYLACLHVKIKVLIAFTSLPFPVVSRYGVLLAQSRRLDLPIGRHEYVYFRDRTSYTNITFRYQMERVISPLPCNLIHGQFHRTRTIRAVRAERRAGPMLEDIHNQDGCPSWRASTPVCNLLTVWLNLNSCSSGTRPWMCSLTFRLYTGRQNRCLP